MVFRTYIEIYDADDKSKCMGWKTAFLNLNCKIHAYDTCCPVCRKDSQDERPRLPAQTRPLVLQYRALFYVVMARDPLALCKKNGRRHETSSVPCVATASGMVRRTGDTPVSRRSLPRISCLVYFV